MDIRDMLEEDLFRRKITGLSSPRGNAAIDPATWTEDPATATPADGARRKRTSVATSRRGTVGAEDRPTVLEVSRLGVWDDALTPRSRSIGGPSGLLSAIGEGSGVSDHMLPHRILFKEMEAEILAARTIEKQASLLDELGRAMATNHLLSQLFFQSERLWSFLLGRLKYFRLPFPASGRTEEEIRQRYSRADELDYISYIYTTLAAALFSSEPVSQRMLWLQNASPKSVADLADQIMWPYTRDRMDDDGRVVIDAPGAPGSLVIGEATVVSADADAQKALRGGGSSGAVSARSSGRSRRRTIGDLVSVAQVVMAAGSQDAVTPTHVRTGLATREASPAAVVKGAPGAGGPSSSSPAAAVDNAFVNQLLRLKMERKAEEQVRAAEAILKRLLSIQVQGIILMYELVLLLEQGYLEHYREPGFHLEDIAANPHWRDGYMSLLVTRLVDLLYHRHRPQRSLRMHQILTILLVIATRVEAFQDVIVDCAFEEFRYYLGDPIQLDLLLATDDDEANDKYLNWSNHNMLTTLLSLFPPLPKSKTIEEKTMKSRSPEKNQ
jgi:hypothetical protein